MPPKSQTIYSVQSPTRTSSDDIREMQLLFDFASPMTAVSASAGNVDPTLCSSEIHSNQPPGQDPGETASGDVSVRADVPRSATVKPKVPDAAGKGRSLQIKQLWEGTVTEVLDDTFEAVLTDKSRPDSPEEHVQFESVELRADDRPLVSPGSVFYWMIGTERTPAGQVRNISNIEFSRLPVWTRSSLKAAEKKGSSAAEWFHANGSGSS